MQHKYSTAIFLTLLLLMYLLHSGAGDVFPVVWDDELYYILQSRSFLFHGTLFTPEILPDRPLMTKPPGWPVLLALWGRISGFDIGSLRFLPFMFFILAAALLLKCIRLARGNMLYSIGAALLFLSPQFTMTANIARMDGIVLFLSILSMFFLFRGNYLLSLAAALSILHFHFNAVWIIAGSFIGIITLQADSFLFRRQKEKYELIVLIAVMISLLCSFSWLYINFDGFFEDFIYDLAKKINRFDINIKNVLLVFLLLCLALFYLLKIRKRREEVILFVYGFFMLVLYAFGREPWYEVFAMTGVYLLVLQLTSFFQRREALIACLLIAGILATGAILRAGGDYAFLGMKYRSGKGYLEEEERRSVVAKLTAIRNNCFQGRAMSVKFPFQGTSLYFLNELTRLNINLKARLSHAHLGSQHADVDIYILKEQFVPSWLRNGYEAEIESGVQAGSMLIVSEDTCVRNSL